jgi:hypothetical protein
MLSEFVGLKSFRIVPLAVSLSRFNGRVPGENNNISIKHNE